MNINLKVTLTILTGVSVAIANVLATKLAWVPYLEVAIPAGVLAFGLTCLCSDLLVEFEGREYAQDVINGTLIALGVSWALIYSAIALPAAPFYDATAFNQVLGSGSAVVIASIITIGLSQHVDVRLFAAIRSRTGLGRKWARNIGSTAIAQGVDTVVFITLAFAIIPALQGGDILWGTPLLLTIAGQYLIKLLIAGLDTPLFYLLSAAGPTPQEVQQ